MHHSGPVDNSMHHNPVQPPTFNTTKRPSGHTPVPPQNKAFASQDNLKGHLSKGNSATSPSRPVQILVTSNDN